MVGPQVLDPLWAYHSALLSNQDFGFLSMPKAHTADWAALPWRSRIVLNLELISGLEKKKDPPV
jgi:hypothetical protein